MTFYIRRPDYYLFTKLSTEMADDLSVRCANYVPNVIASNNLTDLNKVWGAITGRQKNDFFKPYINIFLLYRINTIDDDNIPIWYDKFVARLFLYLDSQKVFHNMNATSYDTEKDRYTLERWHSYDERHKDADIDKNTTDFRSYDYPQYTTDVVTPPTIPNLVESGVINENENTVTGVLSSVNINDNKSVTTRETNEAQDVSTKSGESDYKESWSIPKEVMEFASKRFTQMQSLNPIDIDKYYNWMAPLFVTFETQSGWYS